MKNAILLNDTSYELHHGCEIVIKNIRYLLNSRGIRIIANNPTGVDWKSNQNIINKLEEADLIIINGEGTLHHDQPRAQELISIGEHAKKLGKPSVIINATYQSNSKLFTEKTKYFTKIYVRESASQRELAEAGIAAKVVPDITFYSDLSFERAKKTKLIGFTDSVYDDVSNTLFTLSNGSELYKFLPILKSYQFPRSVSWKATVRFVKWEMVKYFNLLRNKCNYSIPYKELRQLYFAPKYSDYVKQIAELDSLVAARYHAVCFALQTLTPFWAIKSNSFKTEGLIEDIGLSKNRIVSVSDLKKRSSLSIERFTSEEIFKINDFIKHASVRIVEMIDEIVSLV